MKLLMQLFLCGFVIVIVDNVVKWVLLKTGIRHYDGSLICGYNSKTGKSVYRIEINVPIEDISTKSELRLKVKHTNENLGINTRLYDLEEEGVDIHDKSKS